MRTFHGRILLDGKPYKKTGWVRALLIGYEEIPLAERVREDIPNWETLRADLKEPIIERDTKQKRLDIKYRMGTLREVSKVEGQMCQYEGLSMGTFKGQRILSSFFGPMEVPEEAGNGEVHFIRFELETENEQLLFSAEDIFKATVGDLKGVALHFTSEALPMPAETVSAEEETHG